MGRHRLSDGRGHAELEGRPEAPKFLRDAASSRRRTLVVGTEHLTNLDSREPVGPAARSAHLLQLLEVHRKDCWLAVGIRPGVEWIPPMCAQTPTATPSDMAESIMALSSDHPRNVLDLSHLDEMLSGLVGTNRVGFLPLHTFGTHE